MKLVDSVFWVFGNALASAIYAGLALFGMIALLGWHERLIRERGEKEAMTKIAGWTFGAAFVFLFIFGHAIFPNWR